MWGLTAIMNMCLSKMYLSSEDQSSSVAIVGYNPSTWQYGSVDGRDWMHGGKKGAKIFIGQITDNF